jgi:glycine betaine/choline ABC-type transport system substrate-binding protein
MEAKIAAISAQSEKAVQEALDEVSKFKETLKHVEASKKSEIAAANAVILDQNRAIEVQINELNDVKAHCNGMTMRLKVF